MQKQTLSLFKEKLPQIIEASKNSNLNEINSDKKESPSAKKPAADRKKRSSATKSPAKNSPPPNNPVVEADSPAPQENASPAPSSIEGGA